MAASTVLPDWHCFCEELQGEYQNGGRAGSWPTIYSSQCLPSELERRPWSKFVLVCQ